MLKNHFALFLILCVSHDFKAQVDTTVERQPFFNQISASYTYSDVQFYEHAKGAGNVGFGLYRTMPITKKLYAQTGIELNRTKQIGFTPRDVEEIASGHFSSHITALSLPLSVQLKLGQRHFWVPQIGTYIEHNLGHRVLGETRIPLSANNRNYNERGPAEAFNYGISAGISAHIKTKSNTIILGVQYRYGLNELGMEYYTSPLYNRFVKISAGLQLDRAIGNKRSATDPHPFFDEYAIALNMSTIDWYTSNTGKLGYGIGIYHNSKQRYRFSSNVGMELNLSRTQGNYGINDPWRSVRLTQRMDVSVLSLTLPVAVRYTLGNRVQFFPELGTYLELNSNGIGTAKALFVEGFNPHHSTERTIYRNIPLQRINLGFQGGIGATFPIISGRLTVKADYRYGLFNLRNYSYAGVEMMQRYFRLQVGYAWAMRESTSSKKDRFPFFNEFKISGNMGLTKRPTSVFRSDAFDIKQNNHVGLGASIAHTSPERKRFQYILALETDILRYQTRYSVIQNTTDGDLLWKTKEIVTSFNFSINNGLRYYLTQSKTRPFIQLGLAPAYRFGSNVKYYNEFALGSEILSTTTRNYLHKNFGLASFGPYASTGIVLPGTITDYIFQVDFIPFNYMYYGTNDKTNPMLRLSLGCRLKRS